MKRTDILIVGAGQAGLAMSRLLAADGIDHVVLERGRIGERWRRESWPSLRLLTPNWMTRLPGHVYPGPDPDGFMRAADFIRLLEGYAVQAGLPVIGETTVRLLAPADRGYLVETDTGRWHARAVVIATGAFQEPMIPTAALRLPRDFHQIAASAYRGPETLPAGGVLVVGASATGVQLAAEIARAGRDVAIAVGRHIRTPRRYRGRDIMAWLDASGFLSAPRSASADYSALVNQPSMQLVGNVEGRDVDLGVLRDLGVTVLGRVLDARDAVLRLGEDLVGEIAASERRRARMLSHVDTFIAACGIDAPAAAPSPPPILDPSPARVDLKDAGIGTVIWATGYRRTYPWVQLPILGPDGDIRQFGGLTACPGVATLGLRFQRQRVSNFIDGVGRDAEALLPVLKTHLARSLQRAALQKGDLSCLPEVSTISSLWAAAAPVRRPVCCSPGPGPECS